MRTSALREHLSTRLADFAWDQWSQMGVAASPARRDQWAADPEALLLLTLELGRDEPRLFDEVFDWVAVNHRALSVQRLRNLCVDDADQALVGAVLTAAGATRPPAPPERRRPPEPFYRGLSTPVENPDSAFFDFGFLKPFSSVEPRSSPPDPLAPINFAFRLRGLLGLGARAEVVRVLLGSPAQQHSASVIAASAGYSKRNVQEALAGLQAAGVVHAFALGNEQRFSIPHENWMALLGTDRLPSHIEWRQLLTAARLVLRWLADPANGDLSDYMLASEARALLERVAPDLWFAGVPVEVNGPPGAEYWTHFAEVVEGLHLPG